MCSFKSLNTTFYRAEVQHVLAEVTEHMAQQHSAHKSLEKLRAENESLALKEKERKVIYYSMQYVMDDIFV